MDATQPQPAEKASERPFRATLREFATVDPRSLGLFRVLFGVLLLIDLYRRLPDYVLFYTNEGMLPNHGAIYRPMSGYLFSIYHAFSTRGEVLAAFGATAIVYLCFLVGWKTKVFQIATLVLVTSLHSRNIMLENGGDVVFNILALWTCFLPLGRRFSVDALLASLRARHEGSATELNDRASPQPDRRPFVSLAFAAIVLNLAVIYYFNWVHKDGFTWQNATSVHYVLWADRLVQPSGVWLRQWVPMWAIRTMTGGTLVMESSIVILLLCPIWIRSCRRVAALTVIALHAGFQSVGHFGLFSFVMMVHAPLLMGPEDWDALARRMRAKLPSRVVIYDAACGICHQLCRIAKRFDHLEKLRFVANTDDDLPAGVTPERVEQTVIVTTERGAPVWERAEAVAQGLRAIPYGIVAAKLIELPGLSALARAGYDFVASRRRDISVALGYGACGVPHALGDDDVEKPRWERPRLFGATGPVLTTALTAVVMFALTTQMLAENHAVPARACGPKALGLGKVCLPFNLKEQPVWAQKVAQYPRFFQGWSMFAPIPPMDDGIIVVDAITVDGRHIDPLTDGKPTTFELPSAKEGLLVSQFWYEFHDRERRDANTRYRDHLRDYLINWQAIEHRPPNDKLVAFEAWWIWRNTLPPGTRRRDEPKKQRIMQWGDGSFAHPAAEPATPTPTPLIRMPGAITKLQPIGARGGARGMQNGNLSSLARFCAMLPAPHAARAHAGGSPEARPRLVEVGPVPLDLRGDRGRDRLRAAPRRGVLPGRARRGRLRVRRRTRDALARRTRRRAARARVQRRRRSARPRDRGRAGERQLEGSDRADRVPRERRAGKGERARVSARAPWALAR